MFTRIFTYLLFVNLIFAFDGFRQYCIVIRRTDIVTFGGIYTYSNGTFVFNNKMMISGKFPLDIEFKEYKYGPEPRAGHACTYGHNKMYVFGGFSDINQKEQLTDLWVYDFITNQWQLLSKKWSQISTRSNHRIVI